MGLADTLKPKMPFTLSTDLMTETELDNISTGIHVDNVVGTNPESLLIALEDANTPAIKREALENLLSPKHSSDK